MKKILLLIILIACTINLNASINKKDILMDSTSVKVVYGTSTIIEMNAMTAGIRLVDNYHLFRVSSFDSRSIIISMIKQPDEIMKDKVIGKLIIGDENCNKYVIELLNSEDASERVVVLKPTHSRLVKSKGQCAIKGSMNMMPRTIRFDGGSDMRYNRGHDDHKKNKKNKKGKKGKKGKNKKHNDKK